VREVVICLTTARPMPSVAERAGGQRPCELRWALAEENKADWQIWKADVLEATWCCAAGELIFRYHSD
jgi:hypothetical protein